MNAAAIQAFCNAAFTIIEPFVALGIMAAGYWAVAELRRHGYRATYAEAIVRAMGAGVLAAQDAGKDPFSPEGRRIVMSTGAKYLSDKVGDAGKALGIVTMGGHAERVSAQLGVAAAMNVLPGPIQVSALLDDLASRQQDGSLPSAAIVETATRSNF